MKRVRREIFREKISITQQYLAEYLGISQALLSLYEKGLRNLPPAAALKLAKLELACLNLQQPKARKTVAPPLHPHLQKNHDKTKKAMEQHASNCSYKKKLAQRQLDTMTAAHEKAILLMNILDKLAPAAHKTKESNIDHLWIEVQKNEAVKKMIRCGDAEQAKLQAKIHSLEAEAVIYTRLHSKM